MHAGKYMFEKLLSGMFLGEVARRVLLRVAADTGLLGDVGVNTAAAAAFASLADVGRFTTAHLARIVDDTSGCVRIVREDESLHCGCIRWDS
jgi:hexokinase